MKYKYFISYLAKNFDGSDVCGNTESIVNFEIKSIKQLDSIAFALEKDCNIISVVIMNFILLDTIY